MGDLIKNLMNAVRQFTAFDFASFKICLLSSGILLGSYFCSFFMEYITFVWVIALIAWLLLIIPLIRYYGKPKK